MGLRDQIVFEEDEFQTMNKETIQNTGPENNSRRLLDNDAQIKQELDQDGRQESNLKICQGAIDELELKQEPTDQEKNKHIEELYADHEVKEEMVLGPVVLLRSIPLETNFNQESPKSKLQHRCHVRKTYSSRRKSQKSSKKNKKQAHICKICKNEYKYKTGLVKHMASHVTMDGAEVKTGREKSRKNNKMSRSVDDATVGSQDSITRNHDKSIQMYVCDICHKVFETKNDIITHMNSHRSSKRNYVCDICNKSFTLINNLKRHKTLHSNEYFSCDTCQKTFRQKYYLVRHMNNHKCSKSNYFCDICNKCLSNRSALTRHKNLHMNNHKCSKSNYFCDICNKCLSNRSALTRHKNLHIKKYFNCDICQKAFKQKRYLIKHINNHRSSEGIYFCDICNKCYSCRWTLKRHEELHSNKYFTCDICQKAFKQQRYLTMHIKNNHRASQTNYFCDICNKCFIDRPTLRRHEELHSNKYFKCDNCPMTFKQRRYLTTHSKRHECNPRIREDQRYHSDEQSPATRRHYDCPKQTDSPSNPIYECDLQGDEKKSKQNYLSGLIKCALCKKQYRNTYSLKRHALRAHIHTNSLEYTCITQLTNTKLD